MPHAIPIPVVLNTDGSVFTVRQDEMRLDMRRWEEQIRFGCTMLQWKRFKKTLLAQLPSQCGCVFTGSGDFHHITLALLERFRGRLPDFSLDLVVFDNHPDNMRYLFGLHCGSWVTHAASLPFIRHIYVIGITSDDIGVMHAWENHLTPLLAGKLTYLSIGRHDRWLSWLARDAFLEFSSAQRLANSLIKRIANAPYVYVSIDKDVFSPDIVQTNWDQGCFTVSDAEIILESIGSDRLVGADITGETSQYTYRSVFKNFLSGLDGQKPIDPQALLKIQCEQQALNRHLLQYLSDFADLSPH